MKFKPQEWLTPNTYDSNFKKPVNNSGVYLIVKVEYDIPKQTADYQIMYVGSSGNLKERYSSHEVLRALRKIYLYVNFYFIECENFIEREKELIKKIQPKFNTQWR